MPLTHRRALRSAVLAVALLAALLVVPFPMAATAAPVGLTGAHWIWYPEGDPTADAPVEQRFFRKSFDLPVNDAVKHATLWLSVDDRHTGYVNGKEIASPHGWQTPGPIDVTALLKPGPNLLTVEAENLPAPHAGNPAGLLCSLRIIAISGKSIDITSDSSWESAREDTADTRWSPAKILGPYGCKPWGEFASSSPAYGPFATGIDGKIHLVYVPLPQPVQVSGLDPNLRYRAEAFDPTTGVTVDLGIVKPDPDGRRTVHKPSADSSAPDWVLILQREESK